jgi:hypothetical protein
MTEAGPLSTALDEKADRILEEIGLDPDGPPEQLTYEAGRRFGERFGEFLPLDQDIIDEILRDAVEEFAAIFPKDPDTETIEFQAYLLGPLAALFLTGRGLTTPEMATLAGVSRQHAYRLNRNGLSIIYEERAPPVEVGVNRRFSGRDDRGTQYVLNLRGFTKKPWPAPADAVRPFLLGMMDGLQARLERAEVRAQLEPAFRRALADLLTDPSLGDLMDGLILGLDRVAQGLRDQVFLMKLEKKRATDFQQMLMELASQRGLVLDTLAKAGKELQTGDLQSDEESPQS